MKSNIKRILCVFLGEGAQREFSDDYYDLENEIVTAQIGAHGEY